jgi:hypothetical protein
LLILEEQDKPREPKDVDRFICAELPDIDANPQLFALIKSRMFHGPCGPAHPTASCMSNNNGVKKCDAKYPKPFIQETTISETTHQAIYRRRAPDQGGKTVTIRVKRGREYYEVIMDNRWIVPYNPILCIKYQAHINLEVVCSVRSVKYLYKYLTKGNDRVMVTLPNGEEAFDEIETFANARYVSASEAVWRLLEFPILNKYPAVDKLPLHLQDEQEILFDPQNAEAALARGIPQTKLTAFFQLNQESDEAKDMLYSDIYRHYIWSNNKWVKRQRNTKRSNDSEGHSEKIGRIPVINLNPKQSELFFLRTLLYHVPGPKSFEDIKTVDGVLHETNQAACIAMGLYEDDQELDKALEEAATIKFGKALRNVFVSILVFCMPANAKAFLERHQKNLSEDLMRRDKTLEPTVGHINEVLLYIEEGISRHNLQMSEVFLPKPDISLIPQHVPRVIREEMDYDQEVLVETMETNLPLLNEAQQIVYDKIMQSVENGDGKLFSLDAPGGTGKTFTLTTILAGVRLQEKVAFAMATSGIAATLLPNGQTVHSKMKVPIELKENSMCNIKGTSALATLVRQCSLMVIDEVTMAHKDVFATLDRTLRDIRSNERPFGGITMLFSGDWRQILPVVIKGGKAEILKATLKASPLWQQVSH